MVYISIKNVSSNYVILLLIAVAMILSMFTIASKAHANDVNLALNAEATASYTTGSLASATDGNFIFNDANQRWTSQNSGKATDWLALDFGSVITFDRVNLYLYNDGGGVQPPSSYVVQYWDSGIWIDATNQVKTPATPTAALGNAATAVNTLNTVVFDSVTSQKLRIVFTNNGIDVYSGLVELEVLNVGDGTPANPYVITTATGFDLMRNNLSANFVLGNDIDLTGVTWAPIGVNSSSSFTGSLDGQGYSITGLSINSASSFIGLFGAIGSGAEIKDLTIDGAEVTGISNVGVLAGYNRGSISHVTISNASVTATTTGGALFGENSGGSIDDTHTFGSVSGETSVGGLFGVGGGSITGSSAAVNVTGVDYYIGGLVGYLVGGSIADSYASGDVTGPSNTGGLVGQSAASSIITNSFALGSVSSGGGLVGYNYNSSIIDSYTSGLVSGNGQLLTGGGNGTITNSYWKPYIVNFDSNGGTAVPIQGLTVTDAVYNPSQPTKIGYTFTNWYADKDLTTPYTFNNSIDSFTTIYAKWLPNTFTVSYVSNGGNSIPSQTIDYNGTATAPVVPTRDGYTFTGWYSDAAFNSVYSFSTQVTGATTLYARWESYKEAEASVAIAEVYQTQKSVDSAYFAVIGLTESVKKDELLSRIKSVQDIIDQSTMNISDVVRWINEGTFQEKDINQDNMFDSLDVRIMLQRISIWIK